MKRFSLLKTFSKTLNFSGYLVRGTPAILPKGGSKLTKTNTLLLIIDYSKFTKTWTLIIDDGRGNNDIDDNNKILTVAFAIL